jgi:hypothetical protein
MIRAILKVLAVIIGLVILSWVVLHVIGLIWMLLWIAVSLAVIAGIGYVVYCALQKNQPQKTAAISYKLFDTRGPLVQVYRSEPTIQDLVSTAAGRDTPESSEGFTIANETRVSILEDTGRESIKIKILDKDTKEKVGWVARSSLVRESKQIP